MIGYRRRGGWRYARGRSANPYLAFTAILAAGLDGLAGRRPRRTQPGQPVRAATADDRGPGHPGRCRRPCTRPTPLLAIRSWWPGWRGPGRHLCRYFAGVKRDEFFEYHAQVTPWEVDHYLTLF